jgi:hypothetical protein
MAASKLNKARETRIDMEVVVDAYGPEERAMGWYCYLEGKLNFPFTARCLATRAISPLKAKEKVDVVGMAPEDECLREMFVTIRWNDGELAVPLSQLRASSNVDNATRAAVQDWHYWVDQGYEF